MTVAVTGTSGKTSVASFVRQIWSRQGRKAAARRHDRHRHRRRDRRGRADDARSDHPSSHARQACARRLHASGDGGLLARPRTAPPRRRAASAAGFTNLSRDHLDYHPDMDSYLAAKMRLFEALLAPGQTAVIDADGDYSARVIERVQGARADRSSPRDARAKACAFWKPSRARIRRAMLVAHEGATREITLPLAGSFMASNALVAAGLCIASRRGRGVGSCGARNIAGRAGAAREGGRTQGRAGLRRLRAQARCARESACGAASDDRRAARSSCSAAAAIAIAASGRSWARSP